MCEKCKAKWDALPIETKEGCAGFVHSLAIAMVEAASGKCAADPVNLYAAALLAATYFGQTIDAGNKGIAEDMARRASEKLKERRVKNGDAPLAPTEHNEFTVGPQAEPQVRITVIPLGRLLRGEDRPAPGAAGPRIPPHQRN